MKVKHGHALRGKKTSTYYTWYSMKQRCTNPKILAFKDYGGRGITFCERWFKFENFLEDMGERPDNLTLDRIDNDKGYYKENCRWATRVNQNLSRRPYGKSGFKGVIKNYNKWQAAIRINGKNKFLGSFPTPELASQAFQLAHASIYGKI